MSCINSSNKPTHSQLKTRPSNQLFGTCKTISLHQALLHKTTLLLHRSWSPTSSLLSRRAARESRYRLAWGQQTARGPPPDPQDSSVHGHLHHPRSLLSAAQQRQPGRERCGTPDRQRPVATPTARALSPLPRLVSVWQSFGLPQA